MKKTTLTVFSFGIIALLSFSMVAAFGGFGNGQMNNLTEEEKAEMQVNREAMRTAIENQDYEAWKSLMEERIVKMQAELTEDGFNKIIENHQNRAEFREESQALKEKYGVEGHRGMGMKGKFQGECPFASE